MIVTPVAPRPDNRVRARIQSVNDRGQFVVLDFGVGALPPIRTKMNIYRQNEIVGVLRLTGPVVENIAAGDIVSGDARAGDEAIWDLTEAE